MNHKAIFEFPSTGVGKVMVSFDGILSPGYSERTFEVLLAGSPEAAAGMYSSPENFFMLICSSWMPWHQCHIICSSIKFKF
jgi:hypothetical protein